MLVWDWIFKAAENSRKYVVVKIPKITFLDTRNYFIGKNLE